MDDEEEGEVTISPHLARAAIHPPVRGAGARHWL